MSPAAFLSRDSTTSSPPRPIISQLAFETTRRPTHPAKKALPTCSPSKPSTRPPALRSPDVASTLRQIQQLELAVIAFHLLFALGRSPTQPQQHCMRHRDSACNQQQLSHAA